MLTRTGYCLGDGCSRSFSPFAAISVPSHTLHVLAGSRLSSNVVSVWQLVATYDKYPTNSLSRTSSPSFFLRENNIKITVYNELLKLLQAKSRDLEVHDSLYSSYLLIHNDLDFFFYLNPGSLVRTRPERELDLLNTFKLVQS